MKAFKFLHSLFRFLHSPKKFQEQTALMLGEAIFWYAEATSWHALYRIRRDSGNIEGAIEAGEQFKFARYRYNLVADEHKQLVGY